MSRLHARGPVLPWGSQHVQALDWVVHVQSGDAQGQPPSLSELPQLLDVATITAAAVQDLCGMRVRIIDPPLSPFLSRRQRRIVCGNDAAL